MKLRSALLAATFMVAPIAAMAQPVTGVYVGAGAGFNFQTETKVKALSFGTVQAHGVNMTCTCRSSLRALTRRGLSATGLE